MGWAEVVHPFHPFRGERFEVLKTRRVTGIETLIVRHPELGTSAVAREWTDWGQPLPDDSQQDAGGRAVAFESLWQLALLVQQLDERDAGVDE